jgi:hypothetical protein
VPFTTTLLILDEVPAPEKDMLGDQIAELKGKIIGQRVLDVEGPTMETNVSAKGSVKEQIIFLLKLLISIDTLGLFDHEPLMIKLRSFTSDKILII